MRAHTKPENRDPGRPGGFTVVELLVVMTIAGIVMAIAIPHGRLMLDRISVHSAAGDLSMTLNAAREFAIANRVAVAVDFSGPAGAVRVRYGSQVLLTRNIATAHGVELVQSRDSMAYGPLGLGSGAANLSIVVRRRQAAETVFVSRLGRIR